MELRIPILSFSGITPDKECKVVAESPVPVELSPPFHHLFSMTPLLFQAFPDPQLPFPSPRAGALGFSTAGLVCPWLAGPILRCKQPQTPTLRLLVDAALTSAPVLSNAKCSVQLGPARGKPRAVLGAVPTRAPHPSSVCLLYTHTLHLHLCHSLGNDQSYSPSDESVRVCVFVCAVCVCRCGYFFS